MRATLLVLCATLLAVSGYIVRLAPPKVRPKFAASVWLERQKLILELFENVCEDSTNPTIVRQANEFSLTTTLAKYPMTDLVNNFRNLYEKKGLLPKGDIFSEYNKEHLEELKLIYDILYHANDFDTFYTTATWARQNVNCGIFIDALYAAVIHRKDTKKVAVPAPYEILPNYFIRRDALARAILIAENKGMPLGEMDGVHNDGNLYTVDANYTGAFFENKEESKISYFLEDVGLNTFYYFMKLRKSYWSNTARDGNIAEYWYYLIRQLNARYNLERVTNGLNEIEGISWTSPIEIGYDPKLMYSSGTFFPSRKDRMTINTDVATKLTSMENNFKSMIKTMATTSNKTSLMNMVDKFLVSEDQNYDVIARRVLGSDEDLNVENRLPSTLEHYLTTLRDPIFWRLNKHYLSMFNEALKILEPYAHNELYFPGVEIMNVEVKKMQTYYDYNEFEITNAFTRSAVDTLIHVNIGQPRLNHKLFSISINVNSLVSQKALVKIFIGPKFSPSEIDVKKDLLKQLDSFEYVLSLGSNIIIRRSDQITDIGPDFLPMRTLLKKLEDAELGIEPLYLKNIESIVGFPSRLLLPKGTTEGFPLQLYVMVAPFVKSQLDGVVNTDFNDEALSLAYPFDRRIDNPKLFDLANTMFKDILISHKGENKIYNYGGEGASKKWYSTGTYDPKERKAFDYQSKKGKYDAEGRKTYNYESKKQSYDYSAKKGEYGKKNMDYQSKKPASSVKTDDLTVIPLEHDPALSVIPLSKLTTERNFTPETTLEDTEESQSSEENSDFRENTNKISETSNEKSKILLQSKSPYKVDVKDKKIISKKPDDTIYNKKKKDEEQNEKVENLHSRKETKDYRNKNYSKTVQSPSTNMPVEVKDYENLTDDQKSILVEEKKQKLTDKANKMYSDVIVEMTKKRNKEMEDHFASGEDEHKTKKSKNIKIYEITETPNKKYFSSREVIENSVGKTNYVIVSDDKNEMGDYEPKSKYDENTKTKNRKSPFESTKYMKKDDKQEKHNKNILHSFTSDSVKNEDNYRDMKKTYDDFITWVTLHDDDNEKFVYY